MEEVVVYKALYNYSPSDDELTEGYIAIKPMMFLKWRSQNTSRQNVEEIYR